MMHGKYIILIIISVTQMAVMGLSALCGCMVSTLNLLLFLCRVSNSGHTYKCALCIGLSGGMCIALSLPTLVFSTRATSRIDRGVLPHQPISMGSDI